MRMNAKWLSALVVPAAMILGGTVTQPGATAAGGSVITSAHEAGYAAVTKNGGAVTSFKYAQATLTVPALNCTSTATGEILQLVFIGDTLGNFSGDNSVAVTESCKNGSPNYTATAQSPCNGHDAILFTVSPGDTVKLVVTSLGGETAYDLTTNASASNPLGTPCGDGSSAGVLTFGGFGQNVANFTQAGFRQIQVQGSNQSTPRPLASSAWSLAHYVLRGPTGRTDVKPEAPLSGTFTSAFANDWLAPN